MFNLCSIVAFAVGLDALVLNVYSGKKNLAIR